MKSYYFDYNATTPIASEVFEAMLPYFTEHFANPSSQHHLARIPARAVREARKHVAALLGAADESEILFTSGGTESNNTAIRSALALNPGKNEVVTSTVEHSSIRKLCYQLRKEGYVVREVGVDTDGNLNFNQLLEVLSERTAVCSLMMANNETGVLFPIEKIGALVKERGILFHVDAVQAAGKIPISLKNNFIDFLSLSAHKIYGPKGIGALYVKNETPFRSFIFGGSQERGRRAGTENVTSIVGLGAASQLAQKELAYKPAQIANLRSEFENKIFYRVAGVTINGGRAERLPNTSNLSFEQVDSEALLLVLDQKGVCASSGSACMSGSLEPSYVLKAMGLSDPCANSAIRFSFGRLTSPAEIEEALEMIVTTVAHLRSLGPKGENSHTPRH